MISRLSFLLMLLSSSSSPAVEAFSSMVHQQPTTVTTKTQRSQTHLLAASRRDILSVGVSAALSLAVAGSPLPASADISEGNTLPQGAQQFSRLIRVKADLKNVEKRVKENASDMDKKEWDNISQFLRQIYAVGDDMKSIAKGIYDPTKQKKAVEDGESLKKYAKAADVPVSKQDGNGFLTVAAKMDDLLEDFLVQLSDVPDEL